MHRSEPGRAILAQWSTSRPHVADLGLDTRGTRTVLRHGTHLALILREFVHEGGITLHVFRLPVPKGGIQWIVRAPGRVWIVGLSGTILELITDACGSLVVGLRGRGRGDVGESGDVGIIGIRFIDVEVSRVDFIDSETRVQVCQWGDGRTHPCCRQRRLGRLDRPIATI